MPCATIRHCVLFAAALLSLTLPLTCHAQGFPPITDEELKLTSEPQAPGAPAVILFREVDRDDNGHTSHEDNYVRIKILTEEGRNRANVEIAVDKASADVVNIHGRTIKPDGSSANFDGKVFEKTIEKGQGTKYLAKTFTLPDVQVGSVIEYRFTYDFSEQYIYDSHWTLNEDLFTKYARFTLKPYVAKYGPMDLRWNWLGLPQGVVPKQGPDRVVRMEVHNMPAFHEEDYMPPANELRAHVNFIYTDDFVDPDPDKFWKHVGKKRYDELESFIGKRKAMEEAVSQIVSPSDPPEVKLRKIYDRVQQIRNTSYEFQKTAQEEKREKEKPPENVEEIWKRGYSDGFHLTWLYLALVRAAGFEACGVWASSRGNAFFTAKTMEDRKLNSNLVLVKVTGKNMYFDPGAALTPFGMLTWYETATPGLCLNKDGGTWVTTSLPASKDSLIQHTAKLKLNENGDVQGTITLTYTGLEAMYNRLDVLRTDDVGRKKFIEERLKKQIPAAAEIELTNKPDWTSSETPLVAEFNVTIPGWASNAGKRAIVPAGIFIEAEKHIFEHSDRVNPIYLHYPYEKNDDVTIELPSGWQVLSVPAPKTLEGRIVTYSLNVDKTQNSVHMTRKVTWDFLLLDQKYYSALRNFFQGVRSGDDQQIVLQPAATAASN